MVPPASLPYPSLFPITPLLGIAEVGREQFCARFHRGHMRDIAYNARRQKIATAAENSIKIIDTREWKVNPFWNLF